LRAADLVFLEGTPAFGTSGWHSKNILTGIPILAPGPLVWQAIVFSKKWDNLWSAYCLHFAFYNFCRIHKTLRVTPAMEAGITDHVWDVTELLA
jgi:hypothetical protein